MDFFSFSLFEAITQNTQEGTRKQSHDSHYTAFSFNNRSEAERTANQLFSTSNSADGGYVQCTNSIMTTQ